MGKIYMMISESLDGFHEAPGNDLSWHHVDEEVHQYFNDMLGQAGAFIGGRKNWQLMDDYWPTADEEPDASPATKEFARIWRDMPKYVVSTTLQEVSPGTTLLREIDPAAIRALADEADGDVVVGGPNLVDSFFRLGLIDEIRIAVHPVVIGAGTRVFQSDDLKLNLALTKAHTFSNGVIMLHYDVIR